MEKGPHNLSPGRSGKASFPRAGFALAIVTVSLAVLTLAPSAAAQGCAMCYDSASQQGPEAARALNIGIVVLLLPSLLLFGGVVVTALRHRDQS